MSFSVTSTPRVATLKSGVAVTGSPGAIFNVTGGRILLWACFGSVSTVIGAVATTLLLRANPSTGSDTDLCTATAVTSAPVGSLFSLPGAVASALVVNLATQGAVGNMTQALIIQPGSIDLIVASGGTTGAVDWRAMWDPLDAGAALAAA